MTNARNFQKELDKLIENMENSGELGKTLLLHSCCAPCSSYCMEYLRQYFNITVFYYNPNISYQEEYRKRVEEQKRLIKAFNDKAGFPINVIEGDYEPDKFYEIAKGLENCKEGGERCFKCYELRLRKTAEIALRQNFDYFTTTLTISPLKNAAKLNEIGESLACEYGINWLVSDFKKKNGYKRSTELSKEYNLYRQNYCGCVYSQNDYERR
jgi:predicted adenine nucleotide alpha hydrolase (AANH) superfamily ATPase